MTRVSHTSASYKGSNAIVVLFTFYSTWNVNCIEWHSFCVVSRFAVFSCIDFQMVVTAKAKSTKYVWFRSAHKLHQHSKVGKERHRYKALEIFSACHFIGWGPLFKFKRNLQMLRHSYLWCMSLILLTISLCDENHFKVESRMLSHM